ncbi:MAG: DNA repair ATPase [Deltaproteobacteria bacterium]|nr:DNA repair ATPase [Deltaproteobacteria bacterium]
MASTTKPGNSPGGTPSIEGSGYEVIKGRLEAQGATLAGQIDALNQRRLEVFGGTPLTVLANERVRTENNCVPCDIANVGGRLLFGYNVFIGLKQETSVDAVFGVHRFVKGADGSWNLDAIPIAGDDPATAFLRDPRFVKDFAELYRYYKGARLIQLRVLDNGRVLAVFRIGPAPRDLKVLRWAITRAGEVRYLDAEGIDDHTFPRTHSFEWTRAGRESYVTGRFPHVNVLDTVFVETTGGDLTIKVENNTSSGQGILSEPVDDRTQSLDDAQFFFAKVGALILLKVVPYREDAPRHFVFNTRTKEARRLDAIAPSCVELPEDHGIIFPGGYALATGECKTFEHDPTGLAFKRAIRSPNGEDVLYVFYRPDTGHRVLLAYNLIDKEVRSPIHCHGWSLFDDGTMLVFRAEGDEPTRVHPMRIWQTPFVSAEHAAGASARGKHAQSLLMKVGNPEAVRAISDAHTLRRMIASQRPSVTLYEDLVRECTRVLDTYPWLKDAEVGGVAGTIADVRGTAELVIDEFEKVLAIQRASAAALTKAEERQRQIFSDTRPDSFDSIDPFLECMKALRAQRGHLVTLQEERYIDVPRLQALADEAAAKLDELAAKAGQFLQGEAALRPYLDTHDAIVKQGADVKQAAEAKPLLAELDRVLAGLQLLTDVTGQLKIDDANVRTKILEDIGAVIAQLNRARAELDGKRRELLKREGAAELGAQLKLFAQASESALSLCDTPERCDQELARLLVTVEELEGRFSEIESAVAELAARREDVFEAFTAKKQQLLDEKQRRAQHLLASAERILDGVKRRALACKSVDELNTLFAADPMLEKARALAGELGALGDSVKSEEVLGKIKAARAEAARQVRDRSEMLVEGASGQELVQLGKHRFTVNTQPFDVTLLPRPNHDGTPGLSLHITGTDYFEPVDDAALLVDLDLFLEPLVSESAQVARVEYLAGTLYLAAQSAQEGLSLARLEALRGEHGGLERLVAEAARKRYQEGYERGVHDADAAKILATLVALGAQADLLRFSARTRALALMWWRALDDDARARFDARAAGALQVLRAYQGSTRAHGLLGELGGELAEWAERAGIASRLGTDAHDAERAVHYLAEERARGAAGFVLAADAARLVETLLAERDTSGDGRDALATRLAALSTRPADQLAVALAWLDGFVAADPTRAASAPAVPEAALSLCAPELPRQGAAALSSLVVDGLLSQHPRIEGGKLLVRLDELLERVRRFTAERVPRFERLKKRRLDVVDAAKRRLKVGEIRPKVLSSFVRNKLVNDVYLPLVGDNLAKQMGAAGDKKRTDLMGMLLLISPPGYGKTTLMEYVASRLGLAYVKANGPALGHDTTSLDPAEAPNATARQEVEKINFAFEMGNNVLLLVDDIQHTHPELLQKFISLCDGTRRVEGVWRGQSKTYDLRGKKLVVCMAGNPYTESGDKFRIPDMLANRADTYNLGDILGGREREFALSYVENALTSNAALQPLVARDPADVHLLIRMAQGEQVPTTDLKHGYAGAEIDEIVRVLQRLLTVQQTLLKVNAQYIQSAATDERFRTEPAFKLQGSYRNMNKLAEKVVSVMNADELERLVDDHYRSEAQTLTTGAEHNLLKLAELRGRLGDTQRARWDEIKKGFLRARMQGGAGDDPAARVTSTLAGVAERIEQVSAAIVAAAKGGPPRIEITTPAPVVQVTAPAPTVEVRLPEPKKESGKADAAALAQVLQRLDATIAALSDAQLEVNVTAPVPQGITELVRLQTILIEASLLPLVKGLASSIEHEKENAGRLEEALTALRAIEERGLAPATTTSSAEPYRPYKPRPAGVRREDE